MINLHSNQLQYSSFLQHISVYTYLLQYRYLPVKMMKVVALFCVLVVLISLAWGDSQSFVKVGASNVWGKDKAYTVTYTETSGPGSYAKAKGLAYVVNSSGVCLVAKSEAISFVNYFCEAEAHGFGNAISHGWLSYTDVQGMAATFPCASRVLTKALAKGYC
eukprot:TRINITY_DN329_c0_g1_i3.p2 TRINITY_DN329_c0_g1~~TRINITY_DN329_c0_g1_i3.p2  ORF type:complete len:162 (+),score=12.93 TRINITY_DN329_c0_g1_i3:102-587(+)